MRKLLIIAGLLAGTTLNTAVSNAASLEDILVEKGVISKTQHMGTSDSMGSKTYWNGGTRVDFPDNGFTFGFNTLIQARYGFTDNDDDLGTADTSSFDVNHARLIANGTALHEEFSYVLEGDFVGETADGEKKASLEDAYIKWNACDFASVQMGQFKTGISRQYNAWEGSLQFADNSVASDYFNLGRQVGLKINGNFADEMVELGGAIFNGESDGEGTNRSGMDQDHTYVAMLRVNPLGKMNIEEEGDVEWTEDPAVSFGAAYAFSDRNNDIGSGLEDIGVDSVNVDLNAKYQGISLQGEYFIQNIDPKLEAESDPSGFYVQAGWFVQPKTVEVAGRYSMVDCDNGTAPGMCAGNDQITEWAGTVNYYFWEHYLKAQLGYFNSKMDLTAGGDVNTNKWIFQVSGWF